MKKEKHIHCPNCNNKGTTENSITNEEFDNNYDFYCEKCNKEYPIQDWLWNCKN